MGHIHYEMSDFGRNSANKMAASRPFWIRSISNFAHLYMQWLSTSFLFIMYINYDHGSQKLWNFWFWAKFSKQNGRQSAILDPISLKFCTIIHLMIVYKFPIHYVYKLWSWVMQIVKVLIFGQNQQKMAASRPSWIESSWNFANLYIPWLSTSFQFIM